MDGSSGGEVTLLAGDGAALVGGHATLVVHGAAPAALRALWHAVRTEGDVLGALVRSAAWELPGLAAAWLDGDRCTLLVRGSGLIELAGPNLERRVVSAPTVSTWLEDSAPPGACLDLRVGTAAIGPETPFRLARGCVPAGGLTGWSPRPHLQRASSVAAPAPAPAGAPTPAPAPASARGEFDFSHLLEPAGAARDLDRLPPPTTAPVPLAPPITPAPVRLRRELLIDGAGTEPVDGPLVLGRRPPTDHMIGGSTARPIALADPDHALSRHHAEIQVDGDRVAMVDRGSVNGTTVVPPGGVPRRLEPGVAFVLVDGTVIRLGGVVTLRYAVTRT